MNWIAMEILLLKSNFITTFIFTFLILLIMCLVNMHVSCNNKYCQYCIIEIVDEFYRIQKTLLIDN